VGSPTLHREIKKLLDCVAICAPRIGQEAAWAGLTQARAWREARAREVADKAGRFRATMAAGPGGFELLAAGGFFGWIRHPFEGCATSDVVTWLATDQDALVIPGTAFQPGDRRTIRVSYANVDHAAIEDFAQRLGALASDAAAGRYGSRARQ
jgi:aspartate/methionine/tyrosine aminotransferase